MKEDSETNLPEVGGEARKRDRTPFQDIREFLRMGAFWAGISIGSLLGFAFFAIVTIFVLLPWFGDGNVDRFEQYHRHLHQHQQQQHDHGGKDSKTGPGSATDGNGNS